MTITKKKGEYRFFYHYYKQYKKMSVHFKNQCLVVQDVVCLCPAETKWNKIQPNLTLQGFCKSVTIENDIAYIQ